MKVTIKKNGSPLPESEYVFSKSQMQHLVFQIINIVILSFILGLLIGWVWKGDVNEEEIKIASKEKVTDSISWAISKGLLTVNSNNISKIEEELGL